MLDLLYDVTTDDGKYRYTMDVTGVVKTYRHGEPWPARDASAVGDKYLLTLVQNLANARSEIAALRTRPVAPKPTEIVEAFNATNDQLENTFSDESDGDTWERTLAAMIYNLRGTGEMADPKFKRHQIGYAVRRADYSGDDASGWDVFTHLPDWISEVDQSERPRWSVRAIYL